MKVYLRIPIGLYHDRGRSAISNQPSVPSSWLAAIPSLIPKVYHLIPRKEPSVVSNQPSELSRFTRSIGKLIPKTQYLIPILLLVFVSCGAALAQESVVQTAPAAKAENKAIDLSTLGIQIGEKVPDLTITNIHNYKSSTAKLSDFKGKLLILDFWATWCAPCVSMIPKMDSLQKEFGDKIQFLSVTYQTEEEVLPFLEKLEKKDERKYNLPIVVDDKQLHKLFPHKYLPHYVWIDDTGSVRSITEMDKVNSASINEAIINEFSTTQKVDYHLAFDSDRPFLINGNGGTGENLLFHSILSSYEPGLSLRRLIKTDSLGNKRIMCENNTILQMFQTAYSTQGNSFLAKYDLCVLDVSDPSRLFMDLKGQEYLKWLNEGNAFCYELRVPSYMSKDIYKIMQEDLNKLFPQYAANVEPTMDSVLILQKIGQDSLLKSKGGNPKLVIDQFEHEIVNTPIKSWLSRVNFLEGAKFKIIDETGVDYPVDMKIVSPLRNLHSVNNELKVYGLEIIADTRPIDKLIIRDRAVVQGFKRLR